MNDLPLALQQLIYTTAAELGLGEADKPALEIALTRAYNLGVKHGPANRNEPGPQEPSVS